LARECDRTDGQRLQLAALAGFVALAAGAVCVSGAKAPASGEYQVDAIVHA
jgi:hypothetical protein